MRSLFRSFERLGVDYLLISGQASVLYGAATFSEDIDIWVRPAPDNLKRLLESLAASRARVYKLTPPMTPRYANAGHGFHFVLPSRPLSTYLDVMARPPRVGAFGPARRRARPMITDWGTLPVVSIPDLVLLKKTRRLSDYDVITNPALARLSESTRPSPSLLQWAAQHAFRAEERGEILRRMGRQVELESCRRVIAHEVARLQAQDVAHWSSRIDELRSLRRAGRLWPEGAAVARLTSG
jgi:hypothetical protein